MTWIQRPSRAGGRATAAGAGERWARPPSPDCWMAGAGAAPTDPAGAPPAPEAAGSAPPADCAAGGGSLDDPAGQARATVRPAAA
eukprot:7548136-Alexandrium_andersonii.AAC.1